MPHTYQVLAQKGIKGLRRNDWNKLAVKGNEGTIGRSQLGRVVFLYFMGCQRKHIVQEIKEIAEELHNGERTWKCLSGPVRYQPVKEAKESKNIRVSPFLGVYLTPLRCRRNKLKQYEFRWRTPLGVIAIGEAYVPSVTTYINKQMCTHLCLQ